MYSDREKYEHLKHLAAKAREAQEVCRRNHWTIREDRERARRAELELDRFLANDTIVKVVKQASIF